MVLFTYSDFFLLTNGMEGYLHEVSGKNMERKDGKEGLREKCRINDERTIENEKQEEELRYTQERKW